MVPVRAAAQGRKKAAACVPQDEHFEDSEMITMTVKVNQDGREGEGVAGPSRKESPIDQSRPGAAEAGRENRELRWAQANVPEDEPVLRPVTDVFRKTELNGTRPPSTPDEMKKTRKRTLQKLKDPAGAVPYREFETAFKDFICSLMERQDVLHEEALLHVADLQQRISAFEDQLDQVRRASSGAPEGKG